WRFIARYNNRGNARRVATVETDGKYLHLVALSYRLQHEESRPISCRDGSPTSLRLSRRYRARKRDERLGGWRYDRSRSLAAFDSCVPCRIEGSSSHKRRLVTLAEGNIPEHD